MNEPALAAANITVDLEFVTISGFVILISSPGFFRSRMCFT